MPISLVAARTCSFCFCVLDGGVRGDEPSVEVVDATDDDRGGGVLGAFYMYFRLGWMYESFLDEPFVYVDISGFIYRVCMSDPQGHKADSGKRDNRDRLVGKAQEHYVLSLNNRAPVKVCLEGIVDPDHVRMCVNNGIAKEYARFVGEVVRFRETCRDAFDEWAEKPADGKNTLLANKIKMRAYRGASLDALMSLVALPEAA